MKKLLLISTSVVSMALTSFAVSIDTSETGNWSGYMNVFENNAGSAGGFVFGSGWGAEALQASNSGGVITLLPNHNGYADNVNSANPDDVAFWTNGAGDGNKFMSAIYKLESGFDWAGQTLTISGDVSSNTLDSRYTAYVFAKTLDSNNWSEVQYERTAITGSNFSLSLDVLEGGNHLAQIGFMLEGLNANPATDWGSLQLSNVTASAVPEPSTYALLAGLAAFLFVAIRRRK
jgi:hypothetical protein